MAAAHTDSIKSHETAQTDSIASRRQALRGADRYGALQQFCECIATFLLVHRRSGGLPLRAVQGLSMSQSGKAILRPSDDE